MYRGLSKRNFLDGGGELMDTNKWGKLGLPFVAGLLLLIASLKTWSTPSGEMLAAVLLGAALVLLGFSAYDWIHKNRDGDDE
jgi:hypothetical protein